MPDLADLSDLATLYNCGKMKNEKPLLSGHWITHEATNIKHLRYLSSRSDQMVKSIGFEPYQCLQIICKYVGQKCSAAMLITKRSAGVAPKMNL